MAGHRYKNIKGNKYGRLTAMEFVGKDRHSRAVWKCLCECGNHTEVAGTNLWNGYTKSCGCLFDEMNRGITVDEDGNTKRLYKIWASMKQRCLNPNEKSYPYYGGRGIKVCDEWMDFEPFMNWAYKNGYDDEKTIDRVDNDGNYEPSNCRWVGRSVQSLNSGSINNSSGIKGVTWDKGKEKWIARIYKDGELAYYEKFDDINKAEQSVKEERKKILNEAIAN
ncbi:hypothetical protein [Fodinibius sp.]|uniref:hypothetical protein n=1 Tax=Fodinibius sp. TaxID=1872440 RepID=UPI002ACD5202|nr:hypothetical protein [Fodinibius sp.]MDZ7658033.1 hypothetical protein [Fodinibius sp.]